jgi:hypothetical protein
VRSIAYPVIVIMSVATSLVSWKPSSEDRKSSGQESRWEGCAPGLDSLVFSRGLFVQHELDNKNKLLSRISAYVIVCRERTQGLTENLMS